MPLNTVRMPDAGLVTTPAPTCTPPPVRTVRAGGTLVRRRFVLQNDPALVPQVVAQLRDDLLAVGTCDTGGAGRVAVALEEALLNALYHGNLEISSDLKCDGDEPFYALARKRRYLSPYCDRRVRVVACVAPGRAAFVIADDGPGFDAFALPNSTDPTALERPSGRGLLLMRAFMDTVQYNAVGNCVMLGVSRRDTR